MQEYLLYPQAIEKLHDSGLVKKFEDIKANRQNLIKGPNADVNVSGYEELRTQIINDVRNLAVEKDGSVSRAKVWQIQKEFDKIIKNPQNNSWELYRSEENKLVKKVPGRVEDLRMFDGGLASILVLPKDLHNDRKFGFEITGQALSTISAYVHNELKNMLEPPVKKRGYSWERVVGKNNIRTTIYADNCPGMQINDANVTQYDTSYGTFGKTLFRPIFKEDNSSMCVDNHSTGRLLYILMKFARQQKINTPLLRSYKYSELKKQVIIHGTHPGYNNGELNSSVHDYFSFSDTEIPVLEKWAEKSADFIAGPHGQRYYAYVSGRNLKNLTFACMASNGKAPDMNLIKKTFTPEDIDHVIMGIIKHSALDVGGTSLRKIKDMVDYMSEKTYSLSSGWQ